MDGQSETFFKNGNILKGEYKNGKREGIFLLYDKSKNKTNTIVYQNDYAIEENN